MKPKTGSDAIRWGLLALALAGCAAAGCATARARLWADTAKPAGSFSVQRHQWAYDGEPVTFELGGDPGVIHFVVFGIDGKETVVDVDEVAGRYRWTHAFSAGPEPQTYEVYAQPFLMRGKCDWIHDEATDTWTFYPGRTEAPDLPSDREKTIKITCYRVALHLRFKQRGGPPKRVELGLVKALGQRTVIPQRKGDAADAPGFLLLGPDTGGGYEVVYTPTHDQVSRAGTTRAELVIEHADGSLQRLVEDLDTP